MPDTDAAATMRGRTVLVTGANVGIGYETARALAAQGARVGLVCRHPEKGAAARERIAAEAVDEVDLFLADLASSDQIDRLIGEVRERYDRLDVLVNNAGVVLINREVSPDGHEMTFAVNHLAPFRLTLGLAPLLRTSAPARVITVSSRAHQRTSMDFDDLHGEQRYGVMRAYGQSKLANILFARELARRTEGWGITSTSMHPGGVATNFGRYNGGVRGALWRAATTIGRPFLRSPAEGADTVVWLATAPLSETPNGAYFMNRRVRTPAPQAQDDAAARRLWDVSVDLTGVDLPA